MHAHTAPSASTSGLLISLANCLPRNAAALRRRSIALAGKLERPHARSLDARASDLLAQLLTLADGDTENFAEEGCLDGGFDE